MTIQTRDPTQPVPLLLTDSMLVTFLKLREHILIPVISHDDPVDPRVGWDPSECDQIKMESDMRDYYNGTLVDIQQYVTVYKAVKSEMYNLKRIRR